MTEADGRSASSRGEAVAMAADVRAGRRTPTEEVRACLDRIAALDGAIGAFQVVTPEAAMRASPLRGMATRA